MINNSTKKELNITPCFPLLIISKASSFTLKKMLGVGMRTPNDLVNGELGRFPIYINAQTLRVPYWLRLRGMHNIDYVFKHTKSCVIWVKEVKQIGCLMIRCFLSSFVFRGVWDNQCVEHTYEVFKVFRHRFIDCRWQCLDDYIKTSESFSFYRTFKASREMKPYLMRDINRYVKCSLIRLDL